MPVIGVTNERNGEARVALSPETARKFASLGYTVNMLSGAGLKSNFPDADYENAGARIRHGVAETLGEADIMLKVGRPSPEDLAALKQGAIVVAMLDPYADKAGLEELAAKGVTAFTMEFMPRITRAQVMDVLSSQSNLAGYKAVIDAAAAFGRALPMMMTAAGTIPAARVFVMGAGVAGLQAIATARRLGAVVSATDVRPAAKEQVASLGAKFIAVEDEEFRQAETAAGYAKPMSEAYQKKQAELVASHVANQDIVITTALIPGRPAPRLVTRAMVESMRPGSVIMDLAAERGGNCELTQAGETVEHQGVKIIGPLNLAARIPGNASSLYARNLYAFIETLTNKKDKTIAINWDDEIVKGTLVARDGKIVHPALTGEKP